MISKVDNIYGKKYLLNTREISIDNYEILDKTVVLTVSGTRKEFSEEQFEEWVKQLLPVSSDEEELDAEMEKTSEMLPKKKSKAQAPVVMQYTPSFSSSTFGDLRDILMKNMEKVQEDKSYLEQAVAVRDNVQSVIDITKSEIEYIKTLNNLSKR